MHKELKRLIAITGAALEAEDRFFLKAVSDNQAAYPGGKGGILRVKNERYYQFIIARALVPSFPFAVAVEINSHDLVLTHPGDDSNRFAVVEMKRWMSVNGEQEIPGIRRDMDKLRSSHAENVMMLIFSANPRNKMDGELAYLSEQLQLSQTAWESYRFPTLDRNGDEVEFWVAGYDVRTSKPLRVV